MSHRSPVNQIIHDSASRGDRAAEMVARRLGSWGFIIWQSVAVMAWVVINALAVAYRWDPYPFILLNLMFSVQAAYTGPILQLTGNRAAERDRLKAEHDYAINERTLALTGGQDEMLRTLHMLTTEVHSAVVGGDGDLLAQLKAAAEGTR